MWGPAFLKETAGTVTRPAPDTVRTCLPVANLHQQMQDPKIPTSSLGNVILTTCIERSVYLYYAKLQKHNQHTHTTPLRHGNFPPLRSRGAQIACGLHQAFLANVNDPKHRERHEPWVISRRDPRRASPADTELKPILQPVLGGLMGLALSYPLPDVPERSSLHVHHGGRRPLITNSSRTGNHYTTTGATMRAAVGASAPRHLQAPPLAPRACSHCQAIRMSACLACLAIYLAQDRSPARRCRRHSSAATTVCMSTSLRHAACLSESWIRGLRASLHDISPVANNASNHRKQVL
jgi:hypothetical protein